MLTLLFLCPVELQTTESEAKGKNTTTRSFLIFGHENPNRIFHVKDCIHQRVTTVPQPPTLHGLFSKTDLSSLACRTLQEVTSATCRPAIRTWRRRITCQTNTDSSEIGLTLTCRKLHMMVSLETVESLFSLGLLCITHYNLVYFNSFMILSLHIIHIYCTASEFTVSQILLFLFCGFLVS